ncbi:hypothetical protein JR316_0013150 [Psilocybe cubensis]|uniref:Uncharacterized protein n=2 Tax=Psilocybe cubensis TaxID=181762 RepID=A0ACB8GG49_PSICU|nr:hypothetical protein JR316_0013150 [Psilocybe cubensis]KAH9474685.1 hypothetical protein JR316_0013150 [Psilocybe cubensis]
MARAKRKSTANTTAATESPAPAEVPSDNDSDVQPVKKRRKTTKRAPTNRNRKPDDGPPALNNMPLDIYYEICATMEPMDVLNLSRTSSYIYHTLMADGSSGIWKNSLSLMSGIPDRPSDVTEAEYARLLFGADCYHCLKRLVNLHTSWSARVRLCTTCIHSVCAPKCSAPQQLEPYVPIFHVSEKKSMSSYYLKRTMTTWQKEYDAANDKNEWTQKKISERKAISVHQNQCRVWATLWEKELVVRRKQKIVARIEALGWGTKLAKIRNERDQPQNLTKVVKMCQKEVTEKDLLMLEPYINEHMTNVQKARVEREREYLARKTGDVLEDVIKTCAAVIPPNAFVPSLGDLAALPIVQDMFKDSATRTPDPKSELEVLREQFPEITVQLTHEMEEVLRGLVRSACGESYEFDSNTTPTKFLWYPRIAVHEHCKTRCDFDVCNRWNHNEVISFQKEDMLFLSKILSQFGFDPAVTTMADMNAADPILECVSCNNQHIGRCTMRWDMLAQHNAESHSGSGSLTPNLILLEGEEAAKVAHRLDEKFARHRASSYAVFCAHCKQRGNTAIIEKHVRSAHSIQNPTEADMIADLDWHVQSSLHWLWPPREEVDEETSPSLVPPV